MKESEIYYVLQCITDIPTLIQWANEHGISNEPAVVDRHFELLFQNFSNNPTPMDSSETEPVHPSSSTQVRQILLN